MRATTTNTPKTSTGGGTIFPNEHSGLLSSARGEHSKYESSISSNNNSSSSSSSSNSESLYAQVFGQDPTDTDDAVTVAVRSFYKAITTCLVVWLFGFWCVACFFQLRQSSYLPDKFVLPSCVLSFLPLWVSSTYGAFFVAKLSVNLCKTAHSGGLSHKEKRLWLRKHLPASKRHNFIDFESLPLMRQLLCWVIVSVVSFILAFVFQVLFFFWSIGVLLTSIWHVLIPVLIWCFCFLFYLYVFDMFSLSTCVGFSLLFLQLVLCVAQANGQLSAVWWTWDLLFLPLEILLALWTSCLAVFIKKVYIGRLILANYQWKSVVGYTLAVLLTTISLVLTAHTCGLVAANTTYPGTHVVCLDTVGVCLSHNIFVAVVCSIGKVSPSWTPSHIVSTFWCISISTAYASYLQIFYHTGLHLARTRGFQEPVSLSKAASTGWVPADTHEPLAVSFLMGHVQVRQTMSTSIDVMLSDETRAFCTRQDRQPVTFQPVVGGLYACTMQSNNYIKSTTESNHNSNSNSNKSNEDNPSAEIEMV